MKKKFKPSDIFFVVFIILLIIPQTRKPIQVALNTLRVKVLSPRAMDEEDQTQLIPFEYAVRDLNGSPSTIQIGKGKVAFISYWATWCAPCLAELPSIQALYKDYGNQVHFVLLTNEDAAVAQQFLNKKQYDLPVYIPRMKPPTALFDRSIPTNFIIDQSGKIIVKETGASDWNSERVRKLLEALLK